MATYQPHNFIFKNPGGQVLSNPYIILIDKRTGDIVNKTTAVPSSSETWSANAIPAVSHPNSAFWVVSIPALLPHIEYLILIADNASPSSADEPRYVCGYSGMTQSVVSDGLPYHDGRFVNE